MPYKIFREGDQHCVYTVGADGQPSGKAHGCHPSRGQAMQQMRALYVHANPAEGKSLIDRIGAVVKDWLGMDEPARDDFLIWKEASGAYRWLATFSNRYRDRDNPPEILSDAAHQDFVKAVDTKEWPMPELWHWHIPGTRWGKADWMAYDGTFTLASGTVDKGHELEAERLAAMKEIKVSHGMPYREIRRDETDPSIITRYRTVEVSPLPGWAAANALTGFQITEVSDMAIPDEKKEHLRALGFTDERITQLEAELEGKAKEADAAGLETKDAPPAETAPAAPAPATETPPAGPSADEVAQAIAEAVKPILAQLVAQGETVKALAETVTALKQDEDKKLEAKAAATPGASLRDLVARAIGSPEAALGENDPLKNRKPKETDPVEGAPLTGIPFIDQLVRQNTGGQQKPQ